VPAPETAGACTLSERRWRCFQHTLFSGKASPLGCPHPAGRWADLGGLAPPAAPARSCLCLALHVDSFDADLLALHALAPGSYLLPAGCPRSRHNALSSFFAAILLLVGASNSDADDKVPAGSCMFASKLVRRSLSALALLPAFRAAGPCPLPRSPGTEFGSCAESGLCVPLLRAVARQGFGAAGSALGGHSFP
jgi:hypothetical protein